MQWKSKCNWIEKHPGTVALKEQILIWKVENWACWYIATFEGMLKFWRSTGGAASICCFSCYIIWHSSKKIKHWEFVGSLFLLFACSSQACALLPLMDDLAHNIAVKLLLLSVQQSSTWFICSLSSWTIILWRWLHVREREVTLC